MRVNVVGGGPGGLYFAILIRKRRPDAEVTVFERNPPGATYGFGVVFSDRTLENLRAADGESYEEIQRAFARWEDIEIHYRGEVIRTTGHGFAGISRVRLLEILERRARGLGVRIVHGVEVGDVSRLDADLIVGADGVNSAVRAAFAEHFRPAIEFRPNRFVWLGCTRAFPAFLFSFRENEHGLWRVHAYCYEADRSTFILEATEETWRRSGLAEEDEDATVAYAERLFATELCGHRLLKNRSIWRRFPNVRCERWHRGNVVLLGDAAHTVHFSVGSGTKLAMEDAIALCEALSKDGPLPERLADYETARRPAVESLQRAADVSLQWFEETERYMGLEPLQFAFSLLTRSFRITHRHLKERDPQLVAAVDRRVAERAAVQSGEPVEGTVPPMFTPFRLRGLVLRNRIVVSPMCMYRADDGTPNDWHLVHLGSRAVGGAGLVMTEMTNVSREGRISPGCAGMYRPEHVAAWRRIVEFVHRYSFAKIGIQLGHAGRKGSTRVAWEGMDEPLPEGNWPVMSASPIPWSPGSPVPREMTRADMERVRDEFARAAGMAVEAGFDLLELHMAHGYLLASFISPLTNIRRDGYGGSLEARMRFPLEVLRAVRAVWPEDRPLSVRISATDWVDGGTTAADAVEIARMLKANGCDIVDVSAGQTVPYAKPRYGRQFQTPFSDRIRHEAGIPTIAVGNITSYEDVNTIIAAGRADLCALARAHLFDPYWTRHAACELGFPLPWPPPYSCLDRFRPRF